MTDTVSLTIELTRQQRQQIERQAHERGYEQLADYVLALISADAADDDPDAVDIRAELKAGLHQALRGETLPLDKLWDGDER